MDDFEEAEPEPELQTVLQVEESTGEQVEQDTQESEDVLDMAKILLPDLECSTGFPTQIDQFGVLYNKKLLDGWVKQPSACCGAAAVAGALNCLGSMPRTHMSSLNHIDILNIYRTIMANSILKKKTSFERCLGAPVDAFLTRLEEDVFRDNVEQSRKRYATAKKDILNAMKAIVAEIKETKEDTEEVQEVDTNVAQLRVTCSFLDELLESERLAEEEKENKEEMDGVVVMSQSRDEEGIESCSPRSSTDDIKTSENGAIIVIPGKKAKSVKRKPKKNSKFSKFVNGNKQPSDREGEDEKLVHNTWDWKTGLCDIMKKVAGLRKLEAAKPSTACIGNWGILSGITQLLELTNIGSSCVTAKLFMGKGIPGPRCKVQVPLSRKDDSLQLTAQWNSLRSAFADPNQVLLFHLKNHYALIFAVREWTVTVEEFRSDGGNDVDGDSSPSDKPTRKKEMSVRVVRQIYTARRGQRPAVWIDFEEARNTMLGWEGYKIMSLARKDGDESVTQLRKVKDLLEQHYPAQSWGGQLRHGG